MEQREVTSNRYRGDIVVTAPITGDEPLAADALEEIVERASEVFGRRSDVAEFLVSGSCHDASLRLDFSMTGLSGMRPAAAAAIEQIVTEVLDHAGLTVLGRIDPHITGDEVSAPYGPTTESPTAEAVLVAP